MGKKILLVFLFISFILFSNGKPSEYNLIYEEIKKIFSENQEEVVMGIYNIGEKKLEKAIPFILRLLNDETITWIQYNGDGKWTRIDKEVEESLIKIGEPSLKYISNLLLKKEYPYVSIDPKTQTKIISIVSKITGKQFKNINECMNFLKEIK